MSPWVMKTASHYHKWTKTWMGLSLPHTTVCPSEKQFTTMTSKFKEGSQELAAAYRQLYAGLMTKYTAAHPG